MPETRDIFTLFKPEEFQAWLEHAQLGRAIVRVQNHHTWRPSYRSFTNNNHFQLLRAMRNHHIHTNGWAEIGQNITTFPDGTIALCRPLDMTPACIKGANTGGIGMEHLGDFDTGGDAMSQAHADTIILTNALFCRRFNLIPTVNTIVYHHWYDLNTGARTDGSGSTKSCPGTHFFGGNSVAAAQTHFLPRVIAKLNELRNGPAAVAPAPIGTGRVNATVLNVRDRPSTSGAVIDRLQRNDRVNWYSESNATGSLRWLRIDPQRERWVARPYVT